MTNSRSLNVALALAVAFVGGCQQRVEPPPPVAAAPAPSEAAAIPPAPAHAARAASSLDPVRVSAAAGSRKALARMARAIACPQKPPSAFAKYCAVAAAFDAGRAAAVPESETQLLPGVAAIIAPGEPGFGTLGSSMPVVLVLRRLGARVGVKQVVLRDPGERDAVEQALGRIGGALDGRWDHVDFAASFAPQLDALEALSDDALDPLEESGDSWWTVDRDGFELRRAGDHWMAMGSPEGPGGRHVVAIYADRLKRLGPKEKSPQTVRVLHLK